MAKVVVQDANAISVEARIAGKALTQQGFSAVCLKNGQVSIISVDQQGRLPHFALLELITGGICSTDLELQRGYYGFRGTPGHEFVAHVVEYDAPHLQGKRVVGEINLACGACDFCVAGVRRHCRRRKVLGILGHPGAFSQLFTLPEENLHIVPDSISDNEAVFVEPLAAAFQILDQIRLESGSEVAVLGDGKLGLLVTQVLLAHGFRVSLYGRHKRKLELASAAGASTFNTQVLTQAAYPFAVECSGSANGLAAAVHMTQPRGTVVMKSTIHDRVAFDMAPVIVNEISLVGSRCGRFEPALQLLEQGRVNIKPMIAAEFALRDAKQAFEMAATRGVLKVLLHNR